MCQQDFCRETLGAESLMEWCQLIFQLYIKIESQLLLTTSFVILTDGQYQRYLKSQNKLTIWQMKSQMMQQALNLEFQL